MGDGLAGVLGVTGQAEGLWAVEGDGVAHFARSVCVRAVERSLFRGLGLRVLIRRYAVHISLNMEVEEKWHNARLVALPLGVFVEAIGDDLDLGRQG